MAGATWCRRGNRTRPSNATTYWCGRPGERFPLIERDCGVEFDKWTCEGRHQDHGLDNPKVFFGGDAAFGPKNIIWAVAHGHDSRLSIHKLCSGEDITERPLPECRSRREMGHPRMELRQRRSPTTSATKVPHRDKCDRAIGHPRRSRTRL